MKYLALGLVALALAIFLIAAFVPVLEVPIPASCWGPAEYHQDYPRLHAKLEAYNSLCLKQNIIPQKRIVMKCFESTE